VALQCGSKQGSMIHFSQYNSQLLLLSFVPTLFRRLPGPRVFFCLYEMSDGPFITSVNSIPSYIPRASPLCWRSHIGEEISGEFPHLNNLLAVIVAWAKTSITGFHFGYFQGMLWMH
jgi:hypothetical protein